MRNIWKPWYKQVLPIVGQLILIPICAVTVIPMLLFAAAALLMMKLEDLQKLVPGCKKNGKCEDCDRAEAWMEDYDVVPCDHAVFDDERDQEDYEEYLTEVRGVAR